MHQMLGGLVCLWLSSHGRELEDLQMGRRGFLLARWWSCLASRV